MGVTIGASLPQVAHALAGEPRGYTVFGGVLRSTLSFRELPEAADGAAADWALDLAAAPPPDVDEVPLGERALGPERYRLSRIPGGLRLAYSHAGTFDLTDDARALTWYPMADAPVELARAIVLGPALALALEMRGHLCLHGSAVSVGDVAIGFVAPKHHGKSTLAMALARAGARFVSDDTLAVAPGRPAMLRPGVASARLWEDAARELRVDQLCADVVPGIKTTAAGFPARARCDEALPLAAVYLLAPVPDAPDAPDARRVRLPVPAGVVTLAQQAKLPDSLVGLRAAGDRLQRASAVAAAVPVYRLEIPRGFARLPAAAARIVAWHAHASVEGAA